jgi:hypothetical protein
VTVGHADPEAPDTYHSVSDSIDRVVPEKLEQMKAVFLEMLSILERDDPLADQFWGQATHP